MGSADVSDIATLEHPTYGPLTVLAPDAIRERVRTAGVVGAGGAGFPTAVKLQAQVEIFLVNAAECEPMLKVDQL